MIEDCEKIEKRLREEIRKHADLAVLGISGGADSSLTAILCLRALGPENVYALSMPFNKHDAETFNALSTRLADRLGIRHYVRDVAAIANAINARIAVLDSDTPNDINKGNSRSRARMCVLYGFAHDLGRHNPDKRVRVMGTGNLSEDFIGYDTKGGDALADIFPIGELFKSEVYQALEYFRDKGIIEEEHINRLPSAGLEDNQTDEQDLGYTYNEMEPGIRYCLDNYDSIDEHQLDEVTAFVWQRHLAHRHKHIAPTVIPLRHEYCS